MIPGLSILPVHQRCVSADAILLFFRCMYFRKNRNRLAACKTRYNPIPFLTNLDGEPAHITALGHLDLEPCLDVGVRLGEAIGASVVVEMLKMSVKMYRSMTSAVVKEGL